MAPQRPPGGRPPGPTAAPTATSQPRQPGPQPGQVQPGQQPGQQPGREHESPPPEGQGEGGSSVLGHPGGSISGSGGGMGGTGPSGGLVRDLCRQSIDWHAYALQQILGVDPSELSDVLRESADALGGPR